MISRLNDLIQLTVGITHHTFFRRGCEFQIHLRGGCGMHGCRCRCRCRCGSFAHGRSRDNSRTHFLGCGGYVFLMFLLLIGLDDVGTVGGEGLFGERVDIVVEGVGFPCAR